MTCTSEVNFFCCLGFFVFFLIKHSNEHKDNLRIQIPPGICSQGKHSFCHYFILSASLSPLFSAFIACFTTETLATLSQFLLVLLEF